MSAPSSPPVRVVVLVAAEAEWRAVRAVFPRAAGEPTPLGESFRAALPAAPPDLAVRFFHTGWGKIAAAAGTQYALDRWQPHLLINLGTCGGFRGAVQVGEVLLVTETVVYDIHEQMGDPAAARAHYRTRLDLSWLPRPYPARVRPARLVSADRDLLPQEVPHLRDAYQALAGDWESGAIAWVATRRRARLLILRGVSDLVDAAGGEAYGDLDLFQARAAAVMRTLLAQLPAWLRHVAPVLRQAGAVE